MKAQVLVEFIAKCSFNEEKNSKELNQEAEGNERWGREVDEDYHTYLWTLYIDGAAGPSQSGVGAILEGPNGLVISYALHFDFPITNNMAEYEALIIGMQLAMEKGVSDLNILNDSQLVVKLGPRIYGA